jgi:hypothetical protein
MAKMSNFNSSGWSGSKLLGVLGGEQFISSGPVKVCIAEEAIDGIDTVPECVEAGGQTTDCLEGDLVMHIAFGPNS